MKKMLTIALCAMMALSFAACGSNDDAKTPSSSTVATGESTQISNPYVDCDTFQKAADAAGFAMTAPEELNGYEKPVISAIKDKMIQAIYSNGETNVCIRKGVGTEDISGDYNNYEKTSTLTVDKLEVTTKGNNGKISVALWTKDGYTFSITVNEPMNDSDMAALIQTIR